MKSFKVLLLLLITAGLTLPFQNCSENSASDHEDRNANTTVLNANFSELSSLNWIDSHVHLWSHERIRDYVAYQDEFGMKSMILLSHDRVTALISGERPNFNGEALLAKALYPKRFYVFGGIDLTPLLKGSTAPLEADLEDQVNALADAGADGIKLYFKHTFVEPLKKPPFNFSYLPDNPVLAKLFQTAAARRLPVLIHLDPQYIENGKAALKLYPNVIWFVTHLGFAGTNFDKLEAILRAGTNVYLDIGHYVHSGEFLQTGEIARDFFIRNSTRVFQSSDFASGCEMWGLTNDTCPSRDMAVSQVWNVRAMLESTQDITFISAYTGKEIKVKGLGLPQATLQALYHDSVYSVLGEPKAIQCAPALGIIDRLIAHTKKEDEVKRLKIIHFLFKQSCQ